MLQPLHDWFPGSTFDLHPSNHRTGIINIAINYDKNLPYYLKLKWHEKVKEHVKTVTKFFTVQYNVQVPHAVDVCKNNHVLWYKKFILPFLAINSRRSQKYILQLKSYISTIAANSPSFSMFSTEMLQQQRRLDYSGFKNLQLNSTMCWKLETRKFTIIQNRGCELARHLLGTRQHCHNSESPCTKIRGYQQR